MLEPKFVEQRRISVASVITEVSEMSGAGLEHLTHLLPTFTLCPDGRILDRSEAFTHLLGYDNADRSIELTLSTITAAACLRRDEEYFRHLTPPLHRTTFVAADGKPLPVFLLAASTGDPGYVACLCIKATSESTGPLIGYLLNRQDDEKARIGRQLHDTIAQNLAALSMSLSLLSGRLGGELPTDEVLSDCHAITAECLAQVRSLSYTLHPPLLDELGLVSALTSYLEAFARKTNVTVEFEAAADFPRLGPLMESRIFGIVQERVSYLEANAHPAVCRVRLEADVTTVSFEIFDDAVCPPSEQLAFSLTTILERARQLGFPVSIAPASHGTLIRAIIARS